MSDFATYKARILHLTKGSLINLQVAKDKAGVCMIATVEDCEAVLKILEKPKRKPLPPQPDVHKWRQRYADAHKLNTRREYPGVWRDGHYSPLRPIDYPDVTTHGGLVTFIANMVRWQGGNSMPLNVVTRKPDKVITEASGNKFNSKRFVKSSRRGPADVQCTIRGKKVQLDAKVGRDTPRKEQLLEQARERKAGGIYEFIHGTDEFFYVTDPLFYG